MFYQTTAFDRSRIKSNTSLDRLYDIIYFQIPVHADLPVGQNLQDHVIVHLPFFPNKSLSVTEDKLLAPSSFLQWYLFGTGTYLSFKVK